MRDVLLITSHPSHQRLPAQLSERGFHVSMAPDARAGVFDLVVIFLPSREARAKALIRSVRAADSNALILVVGHDDDVSGATDALAAGANEYLAEVGDDPSELLFVMGVALGLRQGDAQLAHLRAREDADVDAMGLFGHSAAMRRLRETVEHLCTRTAGAPVVLITGETGTGKGVLAKMLHYRGARRHRTFVSVNCAALPENLVEGELFGHERGAFTSAHSAREGLFETAHRGTLFLDEVSSMPLPLQAKLLTVIEDRAVRRVGGRASRHVDVQIIAATNQGLESLVASGGFRRDLFYRLNVVALQLPPLRERGDDVVLLAQHFVDQAAREHGIAAPALAPSALAFLKSHRWPGNVRELKNRIESIVMMHGAGAIEAMHFGGGGERGVVVDATGDRPRVTLPADGVDFEALEREVLRMALEACDGNASQAARWLRMPRQAFVYRVKKFGLSR